MADLEIKNFLMDLEKFVKLGLGDAILRLIRVETMRTLGISAIPEALVVEEEMIVEALNQIELALGFDCNDDGVPDTVEIFERSAQTSCCRIIPQELYSKRVKDRSRKGRKSSRKKKA